MIRVHVICEGQTEEAFVNRLLVPAFSPRGIHLLPSLVGRPGHKGGNINRQRLLGDIRLRLLSDQTAHTTTLVDYYGLATDFPGKSESKGLPTAAAKATCVAQHLVRSVETMTGSGVLRHFIPYVQMHEFEGLLFSDPQALATGIGHGDLSNELQRIRSTFSSPEEINDSPETAPSKRLTAHFPAYQKVIHGTLGAEAIGLRTIRQHCPLFDQWLTALEGLTS